MEARLMRKFCWNKGRIHEKYYWMKAGFSIKWILYFAPNCPQQIVAPNCPRRIVRAKLSCAELSGHPCEEVIRKRYKKKKGNIEERERRARESCRRYIKALPRIETDSDINRTWTLTFCPLNGPSAAIPFTYVIIRRLHRKIILTTSYYSLSASSTVTFIQPEVDREMALDSLLPLIRMINYSLAWSHGRRPDNKLSRGR